MKMLQGSKQSASRSRSFTAREGFPSTQNRSGYGGEEKVPYIFPADNKTPAVQPVV
jgi:hypothetical protein